MNTTHSTEAHDIAHGSGPHPDFFATINYEGVLNPSRERTRPNGLFTPGSPVSQFTGMCSILNFTSMNSRTYLSLAGTGTGLGYTDGTGTSGTGTGGTGTGGTGTGGTGTGGTGTGGNGTGGTGTGGTGTGGTGTGGTGTGDTGTGGTGLRMAPTRLASLKAKRKDHFRQMRVRVEAGARSFIGNIQELMRRDQKETFPTGPISRSVSEQHVTGLARQYNGYVSDTLEFDGLGIS